MLGQLAFMKYFASKIAIAVLLSLFISGLTHADLVIESGPYSLNNDLHWLKTTENLSIDQVSSLPLSRFEKPLNRAFSDGYNTAHYWFRFTLDFSKAKESKWLLEIPFSLLDHVTLYEPENLGGFKVTETGDRRPFTDRPTPLHHFVFPLMQDFKNKTYFIHVQTQDSVQVPIELWPEAEYLPHYSRDLGVQMAFFGAMLVMIIYNIFIFFSTRDKNYLFYVAFISLMVLFQMGLQGFSHQFIWPNNPWWSNISTPIFGVLSLFCGLLFVRNLLNTKKNIPKFNKLLTVVSYAMLFGILLTLFGDYDLAINVSLFATSVFFNFALVAIVLLVMKGHRTAKIVLVAWSVFLISGSLSMLGIMGFLPLEYANTHTLQIGSTVEVILLSLALADRIKLLRQEKIDMEIMSGDILRLANEQLEKSNKMKDAFIATMSHEIKTPMNAILGSSQLLKGEMLNTEQNQYVEVIERSGSSLLITLDNILEYSKLEAGKVVTIDRETDVIELCEEVIGMFEIQLMKKSVRIWFSYSDDFPESFYIDGVLLKHMIMNLLSNAVKFTQQGFIWLHISVAENDRLIVQVTDSGIGMNQDQVKRIFRAFMQADDSTSRTYGGTGLGLVISKRICELLDGDVAVNSTEGEGTTFVANISASSLSNSVINPNLSLKFCLDNEVESNFYKARFNVDASDSHINLKLNAGNQVVISKGQLEVPLMGVLSARSILKACDSLSLDKEKTQVADIVKTPSQSTLKVLAVDDDNTNRMIISKMLERLGISFQVVNSGQEAIKAIKHNEFDIVLMDIEMPEKDGYETTREIRRDEQANGSHPIKIVALSAHGTSEFKEKAQLSGMNEFISKPVKITDLESLFK